MTTPRPYIHNATNYCCLNNYFTVGAREKPRNHNKQDINRKLMIHRVWNCLETGSTEFVSRVNYKN